MNDHGVWSAHPKGADHPVGDPNGGDLAEPARSDRVVGIGAICDFRTGGPEPGPSQSFSSANLSCWRIGDVWSLTIAVSPSDLM